MDNDENWKDCWKKPVKVQYREITKTEEFETREGKLYGYADKDVLLKGVRGEVYPCKIDIFNETYSLTEPKSEEQIRADEREKKIFNQCATHNSTNCYCVKCEREHREFIITAERTRIIEVLEKMQIDTVMGQDERFFTLKEAITAIKDDKQS